MRKRSPLLKLLTFFGILAFVLVCCYVLRHLVIGSFIPMDYVVEAEFQELPPDDKELEQWLLKQPGVYIGFVQRDGNRVVAVWGNTRTFYWNSVTPNLRDEFERFGYNKLVSYQESKSYRDK
jgi:hypothetical protein